jgi:hypothetical protein
LKAAFWVYVSLVMTLGSILIPLYESNSPPLTWANVGYHAMREVSPGSPHPPTELSPQHSSGHGALLWSRLAPLAFPVEV